MSSTDRFAAVELGGMSIRVAIAEGRTDNMIARMTIKTGDPESTLATIVAWLKKQFAEAPFQALGIASFGPIDPRVGSPTFGQITSTPKEKWRNFDVYKALDVFGVPVGFDTDVNAPAMYEYMYANQHATSAADAITSCAYITVGTGVGIGLVVNDKPVHGLLHPEGGHMPYPKRKGDTFEGLEGWTIPQGIESNACALALQARAGLATPDELADLDDDHPVWAHAAHFLAGACVNLILLASPEKIVLGGGVLNRACLFPMIRKETQRMLNGYIQVDSIVTSAIDKYIVPAIHTNDAGIIGALALAEAAVLEIPVKKKAIPSTYTDHGGGPLIVGMLLGASFTLWLQRAFSQSG
eukprot:m.258998 g.258998  ORF g.258998 m.258998 type:complete len:354 (-) comp37431_c0_seq1:52-1113(-)